MYSSSVRLSTSSTTLPCSYISTTMNKSSSFLKKITKNPIKNKVGIVTPVIASKAETKYVPITIPAALSDAQKQAAPISYTRTPQNEIIQSEGFFKKFAKATLAAKTCLESSEKKLSENKLTFIPIITKRNDTIALSKADKATESVWYDSEPATELAQRIWDNDTAIYNNLDHVVEWIGNGKTSSNLILQSYMAHFNFQYLKLEQAFRNLCAKLHLKGETQQIDRILIEFSIRYYECNPHCIFGSIDIIHAVVYSLLLLNTDLHVAEGDYKKMTQAAFIKNTMDAVFSGTPPTAMSSNSVQSFDIIPLQRTPSNTSDISNQSSTYAASLDSALPRNLSLSLGSKSWQSEIKSLLKQMYSSIRQSQLSDPSSPPASIYSSNRVGTALRRSVSAMIKRKSTRNIADESFQNAAASAQNTFYYASDSPYYKEGLVFRKHLLESKDQKAKHRDWKECFAAIEGSQLCTYKLNATSISNSPTIDGGNWMSTAQPVDSIDLKHSLAIMLPSGYSQQRQHAFSLQLSNGAIFIFQVGSAIQLQEWASACNYHAAMNSKSPLIGDISSMEYEWDKCLENDNASVVIYNWQAPASPTINSKLNKSAKLEALYKHVSELTAELDMHRDIKPMIEARFQKNGRLASKSMMN